MAITLPSNVRGPILELTLSASASEVDVVLRNATTGKTLSLAIPANWSFSEESPLILDWFRRTITSGGADFSFLLDSEDNSLWLELVPLQAGPNDIDLEVGTPGSVFTSAPVNGPSGIAVNATHIFWTNGSAVGSTKRSIGRAKLDGTEVNNAFISLTEGGSLRGIAVNATHIFWTHGTSSIGRAKLDGSEVNTAFIPSVSAKAVAVNGTHIFWSDSGNNIGRAKLDGSEVNKNFVVLPGTVSHGIALDASYVYWGDTEGGGVPGVNGRIGRAKLNGSEPNANFITASDQPDHLAIAGGYIYWGDSGDEKLGRTVGRAKLDGSEVNQRFLPGESKRPGVALSGTRLYWSDLTEKTIRSASLVAEASATLRWEKGYY
jgi:virginiamycin B lyase